MFRYVASIVSDRTEHPIIFSMFPIGLVFFAAALVAEYWLVNGVAAGFLGIYAGIAALLGIGGYAVLYLSKGVSVLRDRRGPVV